MKQCPKCNASIIDTAKFCSKCGVNIKKYEEENAKDRFCPECGTEIPSGSFCPECGYNIGNNLNSEDTSATTDTYGDDWLSDLENSSNAEVATMKAQKSKEQMEKALAAFEYEEHTDGTYTIVALKDKHALNITVPEGVVAIADHSFEGCNAIKITLPNTILQIGNCAFKGCQNLTDINLSNSLIIVGDEAFAECEMLNIELPASVCKVGKDALKNTVQDKQRQVEEKRKEEEARKAELAKWEVGGNPMFGSYYKDSSGSKSPIEWIVLARNGSMALMISKYGIDCKQYNPDYVDTTWETAPLRVWLNGEFIKEAFSDTEQQKIHSTRVSTPNNSQYNTNGGNPTNDKIFLLSIEEANQYFATNDQWKCSPTAYAVSNGAFKADNNGCCAWWLRSPGLCQNDAAYSAYVGVIGVGSHVTNANLGVRPALWVNLDSNLKEQKDEAMS